MNREQIKLAAREYIGSIVRGMDKDMAYRAFIAGAEYQAAQQKGITGDTIKKLNSVLLCLQAHPDNEPDSEFADRISDLEEIIASTSQQGEEELRLLTEIDRLKDTLHMDQTGLAAGLAKINKIVDGYHWVTEGRGPYAYNDDEYRAEIRWMLDNVRQAATEALSTSRTIAHNVCCKKESGR